MKVFVFMIVALLLISCKKQSLPFAKLNTYPPNGDTTVLFELDASQSFDASTYQIALKFRWDFDDDRIWDTGFSNESIMVKQFPVPGTYHIAVEVMNLDGCSSVDTDSIVVFSLRSETSSLTDTRDGQTYSTVNFGGRWWMSECLRYGTEIDPLNQKMNNNGVPERIVLDHCYGTGTFSVYSWYEAINYDLNHNQGICPDGWHIPAQMEWQALYTGFPMLYIAKQLGENGPTGMNLQNGAFVTVDAVNQFIWCNSTISSFWTSDYMYDTSKIFFAAHLNFNEDGIKIGFLDQWQLSGYNRNLILSSVRCVKNQD